MAEQLASATARNPVKRLRNVVDRNERDVIYGFRCVLATEPDGDAKNE
jgi:hypothetical protein